MRSATSAHPPPASHRSPTAHTTGSLVPEAWDADPTRVAARVVEAARISRKVLCMPPHRYRGAGPERSGTVGPRISDPSTRSLGLARWCMSDVVVLGAGLAGLWAAAA